MIRIEVICFVNQDARVNVNSTVLPAEAQLGVGAYGAFTPLHFTFTFELSHPSYLK